MKSNKNGGIFMVMRYVLLIVFLIACFFCKDKLFTRKRKMTLLIDRNLFAILDKKKEKKPNFFKKVVDNCMQNVI
jgi:hypothetical protein